LGKAIDYALIATALDDPKMVRKIALAARPEMIIDYKGSVLVDSGAMEYISDFTVITNAKIPDVAQTCRGANKRRQPCANKRRIMLWTSCEQVSR
jgi:hypothetical protein